ncbi:MAG: winged helix-turn-helix domain-containing protein [Nanoarchaeota archaeon]
MKDASENESRILRFLVKHFSEKHSINQLAKHANMTPMGMYKLLKRLEQEGVLIPEHIANAVFYRIDFASDFAKKRAALALFEKPQNAYAAVQVKDLERLKPCSQAAVLFGSVLKKGEKAGDIDVLFIVRQGNYPNFSKALESLQRLKPKRISPVIQTHEDFMQNLRKQDKVIIDALQTGIVLWGHDTIVEAIVILN